MRDKWRAKEWIIVEAPPSFGGAPIAYIPITDREKAIGRVVETTLYDLLKDDPQHMAIKLYFQIVGFEGDRAKTIFKGHEYSREYLKSLVRRGTTTVDMIADFTTKDGAVVRVYAVAFTQRRVNNSRKKAIRKVAYDIVAAKTAKLTYEQFAQETVLGKVASEIYNEAKKITILRHVGVRKTKLVRRPPAPEVAAPVEAAEAQPTAA
jgi:small subunit ribosomal protein S3Ae